MIPKKRKVIKYVTIQFNIDENCNFTAKEMDAKCLIPYYISAEDEEALQTSSLGKQQHTTLRIFGFSTIKSIPMQITSVSTIKVEIHEL